MALISLAIDRGTVRMYCADWVLWVARWGWGVLCKKQTPGLFGVLLLFHPEIFLVSSLTVSLLSRFSLDLVANQLAGLVNHLCS